MEMEPESGRAYKHVMGWLQSCRDVAGKKSEALKRNDLAALEECLDQEASLVSQHSALIESSRTVSRNPGFAASPALETLAGAAAEIRRANHRNQILMKAGLEFAQTLLAAMRPSATYSMGAENGTDPWLNDPILSLKC